MVKIWDIDKLNINIILFCAHKKKYIIFNSNFVFHHLQTLILYRLMLESEYQRVVQCEGQSVLLYSCLFIYGTFARVSVCSS